MNPIDHFTDDYFFLSNFYMHPVTYEGVTYPSSEHAYQAAKSLDRDQRLEVSKIKRAGDAKKAGQRLTLRPGWDKGVKLEVMRDILRIKFSDYSLRNRLLETGDRELIESNTWNDTFWGVCNGHGRNWLGKLLMELREEIKNATGE